MKATAVGWPDEIDQWVIDALKGIGLVMTARFTLLVVTGIGDEFHIIMLSSGGAKEKASLLDAAQALVKNGYTIYATAGTATAGW